MSMHKIPAVLPLCILPLGKVILRSHSILLENGASGQTMSKDGMTPLDIAMMQGNQEIADAISKSAPKLKPLL
jgi:ankyrin repeat protein